MLTRLPRPCAKQKAEKQLDAALAYKPSFLDGFLGAAQRLSLIVSVQFI